MVSIKQSYRPITGHFDEMMTSEGQIRPHWVPLVERLRALSRTELTRRVQDSRRVIRENGVTYHVQKASSAQDSRPWPLDVVPFVISAEDWETIETAVVQRATLLNAVLADVYGPQTAIHEGMLPAELVFGHPEFHRPCHGVSPAGDAWLNTYCVDLARSPDGRWWFISDRTEVPEGAGYALENRVIVGQTFPQAFDGTGTRRIASYFAEFRRTLMDLSPAEREHPRIVVLSEGPSAQSYFEHAFLARYLGYSLVEGADLTVRDHRVYLRTLGGLLPVDVILRRLPSRACDPLTLGQEFSSGTPGLGDVVRAGQVAVANPLGSGFAESPALMAFLPTLAKHFLSEPLRIPSVATWWCGQEGPLDYVLDHLDRLVVKTAFPQTDGRFARLPRRAGRQALAERIRRQPAAYAAHEPVPLSTAPSRAGTRIVPRFVVVRAYAVRHGDTYRVMPGGLARVSNTLSSLDVTVRGGGASKDVWVVGRTEEPGVTLLPRAVVPVDVSRATFDLPSRIGENLFWLGRYAERLEAMARLLRAMLPLLSEESTRHSASGLASAQAFLHDLGYAQEPAEPDGGEDPEPNGLNDALQRLLFYVILSDRKGGFGWQVRHLREAASLLRDRLSADIWRIVSRLQDDYLRHRSGVRGWWEFGNVLDHVVVDLVAFGGAAADGMTRGHGWRLLEIGRRLERAIQMLELLRHGLVTVAKGERSRFELLLDTADSAITYRSRYLTSLQADLVIDLLLIDDANPRSVAYQLERLKTHVQELPTRSGVTRSSDESRLLTDALAAVQLAKLDELARVEDGRRNELDTTLTRIQDDLQQLSEALTRDYLTHVQPLRSLTQR